MFVSSGTENGFTQISINISIIEGDASNDVLIGTALNDHLSGLAGSDVLNGAEGDDTLVDGLGRDRMFGGEGADIFQFVEDGTLDLIHDFEISRDRIDLSQITDVSDMQSINILPRSYGVVILAGDEEIRIETMDGATLTAQSFSFDDFIF